MSMILFSIHLFYNDDALTKEGFTMQTEQLTICLKPKLRARLDTRLTGLSPLVSLYC